MAEGAGELVCGRWSGLTISACSVHSGWNDHYARRRSFCFPRATGLATEIIDYHQDIQRRQLTVAVYIDIRLGGKAMVIQQDAPMSA
jgi:hypothetical protein